MLDHDELARRLKELTQYCTRELGSVKLMRKQEDPVEGLEKVLEEAPDAISYTTAVQVILKRLKPLLQPPAPPPPPPTSSSRGASRPNSAQAPPPPKEEPNLLALLAFKDPTVPTPRIPAKKLLAEDQLPVFRSEMQTYTQERVAARQKLQQEIDRLEAEVKFIEETATQFKSEPELVRDRFAWVFDREGTSPDLILSNQKTRVDAQMQQLEMHVSQVQQQLQKEEALVRQTRTAIEQYESEYKKMAKRSKDLLHMLDENKTLGVPSASSQLSPSHRQRFEEKIKLAAEENERELVAEQKNNQEEMELNRRQVKALRSEHERLVNSVDGLRKQLAELQSEHTSATEKKQSIQQGTKSLQADIALAKDQLNLFFQLYRKLQQHTADGVKQIRTQQYELQKRINLVETRAQAATASVESSIRDQIQLYKQFLQQLTEFQFDLQQQQQESNRLLARDRSVELKFMTGAGQQSDDS